MIRQDVSDPEAAARSDRLGSLVGGTSIDTALEFFDSLPAVEIEEMLGAWKGSGFDTGNPFDGVLESFGWHGKRFDGVDDVYPLVMHDAKGRQYCLNPALVPTSLLRHSGVLHNPGVARLARRLAPVLFRTDSPGARLRTTVYRGVATAAMCYDSQPIHDVFRKVDDDTVVGAMDLRGAEAPFMFVLRRELPEGRAR